MDGKHFEGEVENITEIVGAWMICSPPYLAIPCVQQFTVAAKQFAPPRTARSLNNSDQTAGNKPHPLARIIADDLVGAPDAAAHSLTGQLLILPVERGRSAKRHGSHRLEITPSSMNKANWIDPENQRIDRRVFWRESHNLGRVSNLMPARAHREPNDARELDYAAVG